MDDFWFFNIWEIFGHQILTLVMVKPGLLRNVVARKVHVHSSPHYDNTAFPTEITNFISKTLPKSFGPKSISELNVKPFGACHAKNTGI